MDMASVAQAIELEGSLSIGKTLGAGPYHRVYGVIHVEQITYGRSSTLLPSLQAEIGGSIGEVSARPGQRSVLNYLTVAHAQAGCAVIKIFPYLTFKRPQARLFLCLRAAMKQRRNIRARPSHGVNVHSSLLSYICKILNAGNVDRRAIPGRVRRFLDRCAPDYRWLHDYLFTDLIDRHLGKESDINFPYPSLDDLFNGFSEEVQARYLRELVVPETRFDDDWVKEQDW